MFLPYVIRKSSIVLLPVYNFSNLHFVIFIEHTYIIYIHKHRIVYNNKSVNPNIYVVVKSLVIKCINIITHVAESSIITNMEIKTWCGMLGEFVMYTVIKDEGSSNGKLSDFSFYIDIQISVHRKFKK